jgi:hypothetical protein
MITLEIGLDRDITRFGTDTVSAAARVGARPAGWRAAGGRTSAGVTFGAVSLGAGPALAIGMRAESGAVRLKLPAEIVCVGSTGLSNVTRRLRESTTSTSRILGGTVSWVKTRNSF